MQTQESSEAVINQFRESHHALARMIASAMPIGMIARRTGRTTRQISHMLRSPAFNQLVKDYQGLVHEKINEDTDSYAELAIGNMLASERHISDRIASLDDAGELLPLRDALAISGDRADRFGYSKRVTQTNVNVDIAVRLDRAIERTAGIKQINPPKTIEGRAELIPSPHGIPLVPPQEPEFHPPASAPAPSISATLRKAYVRR